MSALHALFIAVDVAERKRDEARRVLQDTLAAQQAAQAQFDQLQDYARETEARWGLRAGTAVQPEVMYHHYHFMDRLAHAAGIQGGVLEGHAGRVDAARRALLDAELRLASLRKVVDRRRQEHELAQMRRNQKQTDERAALRFGNSRRNAAHQEH